MEPYKVNINYRRNPIHPSVVVAFSKKKNLSRASWYVIILKIAFKTLALCLLSLTVSETSENEIITPLLLGRGIKNVCPIFFKYKT